MRKNILVVAMIALLIASVADLAGQKPKDKKSEVVDADRYNELLIPNRAADVLWAEALHFLMKFDCRLIRGDKASGYVECVFNHETGFNNNVDSQSGMMLLFIPQAGGTLVVGRWSFGGGGAVMRKIFPMLFTYLAAIE
jgi:hypothetical protein